MQAIKQAAFLRPISRPSSPAPTPPSTQPKADASIVADPIPTVRTTSRGPLNRLSLNSLRGKPPSPRDRDPVPQQTTLVQDGSYLEALGLKISEAVSKALAPVSCASHGALPEDALNGRRALPAGRGSALGACIEAELNAAKEKPHLYKAIVRLLQRPMTVLITNLSGQLLPLLSSPKFASTETALLNSVQLHALSIAGFASELLTTFHTHHLGAGGLTEARGDGLQSAREGLEGIITRVLNPIMAKVKEDILPLIADLEQAPTESWVPNSKTTALGTFKSAFINQSYHPALNTLHTKLITHVKNLQKCHTVCGKSSDSHIAALTISIIWRALVSISHRKPQATSQYQKEASPSPSTMTPTGFKKRLTPPSTPRMAMAFKAVGVASRPPSPTYLPISRSGDAKATYDLLRTVPRPCESNADACEAIEEAFNALKALFVLFDTLETFTGKIDETDLEVLTDELPALIALPVLLSSNRLDTPIELQVDVSSLLAMGEKEYRTSCLTSFGREEESAPVVIKKLLDVFLLNSEELLICQWLEDQLEE